MASLILGGGYLIYSKSRDANRKRKAKKANARMQDLLAADEHPTRKTERDVVGTDDHAAAGGRRSSVTEGSRTTDGSLERSGSHASERGEKVKEKQKKKNRWSLRPESSGGDRRDGAVRL